jgi:hypothetical protein
MERPKAARGQEVQGFMGAVNRVVVQPGIHGLPQYAKVHRFILIVKAFPLEHTGEPLHEGLLLGGLGPCPVG